MPRAKSNFKKFFQKHGNGDGGECLQCAAGASLFIKEMTGWDRGWGDGADYTTSLAPLQNEGWGKYYNVKGGNYKPLNGDILSRTGKPDGLGHVTMFYDGQYGGGYGTYGTNQGRFCAGGNDWTKGGPFIVDTYTTYVGYEKAFRINGVAKGGYPYTLTFKNGLLTHQKKN